MGTTLSLLFRRLATKFSNLVQKKNPPETEEGSIEAEKATFFAVYNYLLATDGSTERYPTGYNKEQERGV